MLLERAITILESLIEQDGDHTDYQLALIRAQLQVARLQTLIAKFDHDYKGFESDLTQRAVELAEKLACLEILLQGLPRSIGGSDRRTFPLQYV